MAIRAGENVLKGVDLKELVEPQAWKQHRGHQLCLPQCAEENTEI